MVNKVSLSSRLGLYHIKGELENLSFRYRCPREYAEIETLLNKEKESNKEKLRGFAGKLLEILDELWMFAELCYRTPYSIWRKMQDTGCDFDHVEGKYYFRIVYSRRQPEKNTTLDIYARLTGVFKE